MKASGKKKTEYIDRQTDKQISHYIVSEKDAEEGKER